MNEILKSVVKTIDEAKGEDTIVIDVSKSSPICDYFVICSANNQRHIESLAIAIENAVGAIGEPIKSKEGKGTKWFLLDFGLVIIHIFHKDEREVYNLEKLWQVFPRVDLTKIK